MRRIRKEDADVDDGGTREILAKSRRLVLLSRNLVRLLSNRIDLAERLGAGIRESAAAQSGRQTAMGRTRESG
jgi:hypothetical protein